MTRQEKIDLLESIQKGGKPLKDLLPSIDIYLLEVREKGKYFDVDNFKSVKEGEVEAYMQGLREKHPNHFVKLTIVTFEECERMRIEFEKEL